MISSIRGMHDYLPDDANIRRKLINTALQTAEVYGYKEIEFPILEKVEVFSRPLGVTSDVVGKEMYVFTDRGGEEIALRPEGTASVVRAFISNGLQDQLPFKVFYHGPMFRYERPQKGRFRQFYQIGIEYLDNKSNPWADIEGMALAINYLNKIGITTATLEINTLGDEETRINYRNALINYFNQHSNQLSETSRKRLEQNPLRILDSKESEDKELVLNAPSIYEFLSNNSEIFFKQVREGLEYLGIKYIINPRLVRGLDYYVHTVFEITTKELGSQGTLIAGGRYDSLVKLLGGPDRPGFGWAAGLERLVLVSNIKKTNIQPVVIIAIENNELKNAYEISEILRKNDIHAEVLGVGVKKQLKRANKMNANKAIIIGQEELSNSCVIIKNLNTETQQEINVEDILCHLKQN